MHKEEEVKKNYDERHLLEIRTQTKRLKLYTKKKNRRKNNARILLTHTLKFIIPDQFLLFVFLFFLLFE